MKWRNVEFVQVNFQKNINIQHDQNTQKLNKKMPWFFLIFKIYTMMFPSQINLNPKWIHNTYFKGKQGFSFKKFTKTGREISLINHNVFKHSWLIIVDYVNCRAKLIKIFFLITDPGTVKQVLKNWKYAKLSNNDRETSLNFQIK